MPKTIMEEKNKEKVDQRPEKKEEVHHEAAEHPKSTLKNKLPLIIIIILLLLLIPFAGFFVSSQNKDKAPVPTQMPQSQYQAPTQTQATPTPSSTAVQLKSFTSAKFSGLSFKGYTLMYPADWVLSEERDDSLSISTVTLSKNGYTLKIFQAATGGAGCIYEGDLPEGPASDYRNNKYKDLTSGFATLRQTESPSGGKMAYNYCQKSDDGSFGQPTSVGHMSVTTPSSVPDPNIIRELEKIVESIKAN